MQRFYCYVDETGQDTAGRFFLVSVIVLQEDRDALKTFLERVEQDTRKGLLKWHRTPFERGLAYLETIVTRSPIPGKVFFSSYSNTRAYVELTVYTTAKAILAAAQGAYKVTVFVDGLSGEELKRFAKGLRALRITVRKVRGLRDESDALIRLADAMAGFIRDALEKKPYAQRLYQEAIKRRVVQEV
jgi:Protein of unknown function (DUF3800)